MQRDTEHDVAAEQHPEVRVADGQLQQGIALARQGKHAEARTIFRRIIHTIPDHEDAWLWLVWTAESDAQRLAYLREAQAILPPSVRLHEALSWARGQSSIHGTTEAVATGRPVTRQVPTTTQVRRHRAEQHPASKDRREIGQVSSTSVALPEVARGRTTDRAKRLDASTAIEADMPPSEPSIESAHASASHAETPSPGTKPMSATPRSYITFEQIQRALVPIFGFMAIAVLTLFVGLGIANLRSKPSSVHALVLPTPAADYTPTPTTRQRTESLWTQVEVAWDRQDWDAAATALQRVRTQDPQNVEARKRLAQAHFHRGQSLIAANRLTEAQEEFDKAIRLEASNEELQSTRRQLGLYLKGLEAYYAQDWAQVEANLRDVHRKSPSFRDTVPMLSYAYHQLGVIVEAEGEWEKARDYYEAALQLAPDMADTQQRLAAVEALITPPNRVVVDLSDQTTTIYQDNQPIHVFTVCTGRASAPTVPGRYEVLDKIPMAYASTWDLDMPWWIGIYWAGGTENGFHALPFRHNGRQVLWGNSLGRPCSFGCIVLDTEDAKTLYDWINVGTVVFVNR